VFATKAGEVYGVDLSEWAPDASISQLGAHHQENRTKRGRVTAAGQKTRNIGRWRWLNVLVTKEESVAAFVKANQFMVGQAKGGWAAAFMALGGKMSPKGWIGRHAKSAGACSHNLNETVANGNVSIVIVNHSEWASAGDPDRIIAASLEGRSVAMVKDMEHRMDQAWERAAR